MLTQRRYIIIFDKTGYSIITLGQPKVVEIVTAKDGISKNQLLHLVASVEQRSEHPMVQAILEKSKRNERKKNTYRQCGQFQRNHRSWCDCEE